MSLLDIDVKNCRIRQRRILNFMQQANLDAVLLARHEHVQYLAGPRYPGNVEAVLHLASDGCLTLIAPNVLPECAAADQVETYEASWLSTLRNDQRAACSAKLVEVLGGKIDGKRMGIEFACTSQHLTQHLGGVLVDVEPELFRLRRRKDPDELARIRKAIAASEKMYERAREIICPGILEIEVFNELQTAAVAECGERLTDTGNDYQCGSRGGPPRAGRQAAAGELYILDLGPAYRGYYADNARTIAVSDVSNVQQAAWQALSGVFKLVEATVKPGVNCRQFFQQVQQQLSETPVGIFNHHLGHGIGLFPHETPHLNPHWDDTFQTGDVFTVEPGLYAPELQAGMRIENDYLVTDSGVELLSPFPLEL